MNKEEWKILLESENFMNYNKDYYYNTDYKLFGKIILDKENYICSIYHYNKIGNTVVNKTEFNKIIKKYKK